MDAVAEDLPTPPPCTTLEAPLLLTVIELTIGPRDSKAPLAMIPPGALQVGAAEAPTAYQ